MVSRRVDPRGAFERALAFSRARRLFRAGDRVLVGSGAGAASLGALAFVLLAQRELGIAEIAVGAVDTGSEGSADAVADAGRFARQLGVTFYAIESEGRSPLVALRELARREGFGPVVLGHTRDDAVARVLAGTVSSRGIRGFRPLVARTRGGVVRPLLDLRDAEALELARTVGIEPLSLPPEPGARLSLEARLRRSVLPRLRVEAPGSDESLLALGRDLLEVKRMLKDEARALADAARRTPTGFEVPLTGPRHLLADALAREVLARLDVPAAAMDSAAGSLARLLQGRRRGISREVVLGAGLIATYLPGPRAVAIRVVRGRRLREEGASG